MILIAVALAPVIVLLMYINFRDKYEKEPRRLLSKAFIFGIISVIPVYFIETGLTNYWHTKYALPDMPLKTAAFDAFAVAAFTEEFFKILIFFILIWKNKTLMKNLTVLFMLFLFQWVLQLPKILCMFSETVSEQVL